MRCSTESARAKKGRCATGVGDPWVSCHMGVPSAIRVLYAEKACARCLRSDFQILAAPPLFPGARELFATADREHLYPGKLALRPSPPSSLSIQPATYPTPHPGAARTVSSSHRSRAIRRRRLPTSGGTQVVGVVAALRTRRRGAFAAARRVLVGRAGSLMSAITDCPSVLVCSSEVAPVKVARHTLLCLPSVPVRPFFTSQ